MIQLKRKEFFIMKVPLSWLEDYVNIEAGNKEFADAMTMSGSKVEGIEELGGEISKVVVGKIISLEKHPGADKLLVSKVDVGSEVIQVVTGAQNVKIGDYIPVALHGSTLPGGIKITRGKLRGIESNGMMCSIQELNLTKDDYPDAAEDGIFILEEGLPLGDDIKEILGLDETVVEFEITSNRPDCLSITGIAREAAATFKKEFNMPEITVKQEEDEASKYASVEIIDSDLCPRYAARIVKDVKIEASPKWMRQRLKAAGVRPINNIVDITNYVMLELGQPMHAFDLEYLEDKKIVIRRAFNDETIKTLDGQERKLDSSMLVIADGKKAVAVAGVMGGENSEVTEGTRTILFESANFDGISVRLAAKKLGLRTEASARFEKGLDVENVERAVNRAVQLVEEIGAGRVCKGIIDCYPGKSQLKVLSFRPDRINALLGTSVDPEEMIDIFRRLEFGVDLDKMTVTIPSFRPDIEIEADLAEEVARFYGYNNIKATLLEGKATTVGKKSHKQKIEDVVVNTMLCCGLYETYTYSFTSPKVFDMLRLSKDDDLRKAVVISNPLGEDFSIMRTTTIPDILAALSRNYNRRVEGAKLFELSKVYLPIEGEGVKLPEERQVLTLGMYGNVDFYDVKGVIEELIAALGIEEIEFKPEKNNPVFHPGKTAKLLLDGKDFGIIGQIHPETAKKFECPQDTYVGFVNFEILAGYSKMTSEYKPLPKYPAVTRDIAMLVKDEIMVKEIEDIIKKNSGKILEDVRLFDVYKGKQVPDGTKSIAYSITFRAEERTLTDDDVNKVMEKILNGLKTRLGAQLRE